MGRSFDDQVRGAWSRFEERLRAQMRAEDEGLLHLALPTRSGPSDDMLVIDWCEGSACVYLYADRTTQDCAAARALGWQASPNAEHGWFIEVEAEETALVPGMVTDGLRLVLRVVDPALLLDSTPERQPTLFLPPPDVPPPAVPAVATRAGHRGEQADGSEEAGEDEQADVSEEAHGRLPLIGFADDPEELRRMTLQSLRIAYGEDLEADAEGDYPIPGGTVPLWVQVLEEQPAIRVFSYVVRSVRDARQARIEIGILNRRMPLLCFTWERGLIVATHDILAAPFVGPQLLNALDRLSRQLDDLAPDLALRVGGKLWAAGSADADLA